MIITNISKKILNFLYCYVVVSIFFAILLFPVQAKSEFSDLTIENLGVLVKSAVPEVKYTFNDPSTGQDHLIIGYSHASTEKYPYQLFDINLATGQSKVATGSYGRPLCWGTHPSGNLYIGTSYFTEYNPSSGTIKILKQLADSVATSIWWGDDKALYIGEYSKGTVERYNPADKSWKNFGIIDDDGDYDKYLHVGSNGRYLYVGIGQSPYYLAIYDQTTGKKQLYWKDPSLGLKNVRVFQATDGLWYVHRDLPDGKREYYRLDGFNVTFVSYFNEPTTPKNSGSKEGLPYGPYPAKQKYLFNYDSSVPYATTNPTSPLGSGALVSVKWQVEGSTTWKTARNVVNTSPLKVTRLYANGDNLLGFTDLYGPVFTYDPVTKKTTILGKPLASLYDGLHLDNGDWYFAGYPNKFLKYNPKLPWTLTDSATDPFVKTLNPYHIKPAALGSADYHYYLTKGADGFIYSGEQNIRDEYNASLGWYDPKTGATGGLREPFLNYNIRDLIAISGGKTLLMSSLAHDGYGDGKLFFFDVFSKKVVSSFSPLAGEADTGKLLEIGDGLVAGIIKNDKTGDKVYEVNLTTKKLLYVKPLGGKAFGEMQSYNREFILGPDGYLWLYIDDDICRINLLDGTVEKIFKDTGFYGNLLFFKDDLYIYGNEELRRIGMSDVFSSAKTSLAPATLIQANLIEISPTPLPGTAWLLAFGLLLLVGTRRKASR